MGKVQSTVETKVFDETPPWDLEMIVSKTDLSEDEANACWRLWTEHPLVKKGQLKEEAFYKLLGVTESDGEIRRKAKRIYELLDKDDDEALEFPDVMVFLFTLDEQMDAEQKLRRSFLFYDQNKSNKITKEDMVEALDMLELMDMERDKKRKIIVPEKVENLFSLMDFANDKIITEEEFLRSTTHYRKLGKMLTIDLLNEQRIQVAHLVKEFIEKEALEKAEEKEKKESRKLSATKEKTTADAPKAE